MASRSNLVCYNVESINLWVGLGWVAAKYGMLVTVPVVYMKSTKVQTLGAKRASCSIAVCWAVHHRLSL